jgi:hypothetical protein
VARDRKNVVLVARRKDRLETLAAELSRDHGVQAFAIPVDLIQADGPTALVAEIDRRGLEVEWLVNNAGFGTMGRIDRLPVERELEEIRLNVEALVALTGVFLPRMVARGRGAVVNVASVAGFGPMAYTATYAATKAFVIAFSEATAVELEGTGVHMLCVCPGFTRTEFQDTAGVDTSNVPGFAWMSAEAVADETIGAIGKQTVLVNGAMNRAMVTGLRLAPRGLVAKATEMTNRRAVRQG